MGLWITAKLAERPNAATWKWSRDWCLFLSNSIGEKLDFEKIGGSVKIVLKAHTIDQQLNQYVNAAPPSQIL